MTFAGYASKILGSRLVSAATVARTRTQVRILAYHGIGDPRRFERHIEEIVDRFVPVTGREVADAYRRGTPLPDRSVWVTFDDGHPEVVAAAMPLLAAHDVTATMFVCPAVIDSEEPFWWEIVRVADQLGLTTVLDHDLDVGAPETFLKGVPDADRRHAVEQLRAAVVDRDSDRLIRPQLTSEQLCRWIDQGHEIGNHTWDHPLLDRCLPEEQARQVNRAHTWLAKTTGSAPTLFAYPNGNWAEPTEQELVRLGYQGAVGFDHQLASVPEHSALRLSRLRIDADAPAERFRAVASGGHPLLLATRRRLFERAASEADPRKFPR